MILVIQRFRNSVSSRNSLKASKYCPSLRRSRQRGRFYTKMTKNGRIDHHLSKISKSLKIGQLSRFFWMVGQNWHNCSAYPRGWCGVTHGGPAKWSKLRKWRFLQPLLTARKHFKKWIFSQILGIDSRKYAECIKLWPKKMKCVLTFKKMSQNDQKPQKMATNWHLLGGRPPKATVTTSNAPLVVSSSGPHKRTLTLLVRGPHDD